MSIKWNEKASQYLHPLQRDAVERGEQPRRLDGRVDRMPDGTVWFRSAGAHKLIGTWDAPPQENALSHEPKAPASVAAEDIPAKSTKRVRTSKPKAKAKAKRK